MAIHITLSYAAGASLSAVVRRADAAEYYDPGAESWVGPDVLAGALTPLAAEGAIAPADQVYVGEIETPVDLFPDGPYHVFVVDSGDAALPVIAASVATLVAGSDLSVAPGSGGGGLPDEPATWEGFFAIDADVAAAVAPEDWSRITPDNQMVARGTDGVIPAGGFTLTSATNPDFAARGVLPGMVLRVHDAEAMTTDLFAVAAVGGGTLTLRRIALGDGQGQPPGGTAGKAGLTFDVQTFRKQLDTATQWLAALTGEQPGSTAIPARMKHAAVAKVASDAYAQVGDEYSPGTHGGGKWQRAAAKHRSDLLMELSLVHAIQVEAAAESGAAVVVSGGPRPVALGRYETPSDWIVPEGW